MALSVIDKQNVERVGEGIESKRFTIAASPEAFRILSDGLYSDKVTAVIRELGTNAIDAHIEAGQTDKPFDVHLPTNEQPWFRIRDFGTGLSHDDIMNLYSTYFGTNKLDNPNVVGQLGLGSKSPLSYTRSFTVTSYVEGRKNHYVIMLDEDRMPQVNYLSEQSGPTTEPNGLEIQIAVRRGDFDEFARKASSVYRYFTLRPNVTGNRNFKITDPDIVIQGQGWRIYKGAGQAKAIMGSIAYPIQSDKIHDITAHQRTILGCNIEIDFPIGALEFTPSRETLSYKKRTSEVLRARLDEIVTEVNAVISQRFKDCKSLWEARVLAYGMFWSTNSDLRNLQQLADIGSITYKGQKIQGQQLHFDSIQGVEAYSFQMNKKYRHSWCTSDEDLVGLSVKRSPRKYFVPKANIKWCEVDLPRGSYSRCQDVVRRNEAEEVYLVSFATAEARKAFCEAIGLNGDEFTPTSKLPKPDIQKGIFHRSTAQVYKHTGSIAECRFYRYWNEAKVDLSDGGIYVEMRRNQAFVNGRVVNPQVIGEIISSLEFLGENVEVIGVRSTVAKQFRKSDDWVDIFTYVRNLIRTQMVSNDLGKHLSNTHELEQVCNLGVWLKILSHEHRLKIAPKSPLRIFLDKIKVLKASKEKVKSHATWKTLADYVTYNLNDLGDYPDAEKWSNEMLKVYPMWTLVMVHMGYYGDVSSDNVSELSDYINLVDQKNGIVTT